MYVYFKMDLFPRLTCNASSLLYRSSAKEKVFVEEKMIDAPCETCYNHFRWLC